MEAHFKTSLDCTPLENGIDWRLQADLILARAMLDREGNAQLELVVAKKDFVTDFASIPPLAFVAGLVLNVLVPAIVAAAWLRWGLALYVLTPLVMFALFVCLVADFLTMDTRLDAGAVIHDWCYRTRCCSRSQADTLLWVGMSLTRVPLWKRVVVWGNVRLFGWAAWSADERKFNLTHGTTINTGDSNTAK